MSTPSQGAQSPSSASELENARSGWHPGGADAGDDPERDQTELHGGPDEAARTGDHLALGQLEHRRGQRNAGDEDDERSDHRPQAGIGDLVLDGQGGQQGDGEGGEEGHQHLERAPTTREQPQDADDGSEQCGGRTSRGAGRRISAIPIVSVV